MKRCILFIIAVMLIGCVNPEKEEAVKGNEVIDETIPPEDSEMETFSLLPYESRIRTLIDESDIFQEYMKNQYLDRYEMEFHENAILISFYTYFTYVRNYLTIHYDDTGEIAQIDYLDAFYSAPIFYDKYGTTREAGFNYVGYDNYVENIGLAAGGQNYQITYAIDKGYFVNNDKHSNKYKEEMVFLDSLDALIHTHYREARLFAYMFRLNQETLVRNIDRLIHDQTGDEDYILESPLTFEEIIKAQGQYVQTKKDLRERNKEFLLSLPHEEILSFDLYYSDGSTKPAIIDLMGTSYIEQIFDIIRYSTPEEITAGTGFEGGNYMILKYRKNNELMEVFFGELSSGFWISHDDVAYIYGSLIDNTKFMKQIFDEHR